MKFTVYNWRRGHVIDKVLEELGINQTEYIMGDIWEYAKKIHDKGLNVMVYNVKGKDEKILFVDEGRFGQS